MSWGYNIEEVSNLITYTNSRGESISLTRDGSFRLLDFQGTGKVDLEIQTQKAPFQDGATYIDSLVEPRPLSIEVGVFGSDTIDLNNKKRLLASVFNPKLGEGILRYEYEGGVKEINAIPEHSPDFPTGSGNINQRFQRVFLDFICPNPFWLSITESTEPMAAWIGGLSFPLRLATKFSERGTRRKIVNDGDVAVPIEITMKGNVTNPIITNSTTSEFIKVNKTLSQDEKLIINTAFGKKRVEIEDVNGLRTNVFHYIDLDSSFFSLVQGENIIEYNADSGREDATVQIVWKNRYLTI